MTYIDELAGDIKREVGPDLLPEGNVDSLFRVYALLALLKGEEVSPQDVHDAWTVWMSDQDPGHRSLKPFAELDAETQSADAPFADAIRRVALGRGGAVPAR